MSENNGQRKQLPRRSSRGVRPDQNQQKKKQDDEVYQRIFGDLDQSESDDQSFSQQLGLRPLQTFTANFANYNYGRGYHYFFNLDIFPRVQGSPSYALDDQNKFKHTYSRDSELINGTEIRNLINRKYIGLPTIETTFGNSKNRDKNVCHYHLFNIEDKKYFNHRLISKYKYILKHLTELSAKNKLKNYTELKKDVVMYEVCQKETSLERRRQLLQNKIKILEERVKNMSPYWDWQDGIYYYFALDQKFHNKALQKGQKLSEKNLKEHIFQRINTRTQFIEAIDGGSVTLGTEKSKIAVQQWIILEQQKTKIISTEMQNKLKHLPKLRQMFLIKQQLVRFPLFIFNFGSKDIQKAVDSLIKAKLEKDYQSGFYIYKAFLKKVLGRELSVQDGQIMEPMLTEDYTNLMRKKIDQIRYFYQHNKKLEAQNINIDELVQIWRLQNSPLLDKVTLLSSEHSVQISLKELMLLFFYKNISIGLNSFVEYIRTDPEIIKLMVNSNYEKFHYEIAQILRSQEFCILENDISRFAEVLSHTGICPQFNKNLCFNFNKNLRIAYVWIEPENDEWETQKDQDSQDELEEDDHNSMKDVFQDGDPKPSKKVKFD